MNLNAKRAAKMNSTDSCYRRGRPKMRPVAFVESYHFVGYCRCWHLSRHCCWNYRWPIAVGHASATVAANIRAATMRTHPCGPLCGTLSNHGWSSARNNWMHSIRWLEMRWSVHAREKIIFDMLTFASFDTVGLLENWTSVAFSIVFSSRMVACDWLWPNGFLPYRHW